MSYEIKTLYGVHCVQCGQLCEVAAYKSDIVEWQNGKYAEDAFPYLTADERELLISRTCPDCWDRMFPEESEE